MGSKAGHFHTRSTHALVISSTFVPSTLSFTIHRSPFHSIIHFIPFSHESPFIVLHFIPFSISFHSLMNQCAGSGTDDLWHEAPVHSGCSCFLAAAPAIIVLYVRPCVPRLSLFFFHSSFFSFILLSPSFIHLSLLSFSNSGSRAPRVLHAHTTRDMHSTHGSLARSHRTDQAHHQALHPSDTQKRGDHLIIMRIALLGLAQKPCAGLGVTPCDHPPQLSWVRTSALGARAPSHVRASARRPCGVSTWSSVTPRLLALNSVCSPPCARASVPFARQRLGDSSSTNRAHPTVKSVASVTHRRS